MRRVRYTHYCIIAPSTIYRVPPSIIYRGRPGHYTRRALLRGSIITLCKERIYSLYLYLPFSIIRYILLTMARFGYPNHQGVDFAGNLCHYTSIQTRETQCNALMLSALPHLGRAQPAMKIVPGCYAWICPRSLVMRKCARTVLLLENTPTGAECVLA
jgi:hypothetical protein